MSRPRDWGSEFPSDKADPTPREVGIDLGEYDYGIYQETDFIIPDFNIIDTKEEKDELITLDLHKTIIYDNTTIYDQEEPISANLSTAFYINNNQLMLRQTVRLMIITSGPYENYFKAKFAYWDNSVVAIDGISEINVYVPLMYHTDTLEEQSTESAQPQLTTNDAIFAILEPISGEWLLLGHFQGATEECPE